jgi:prepilin-type N-terminal cleavage/methylation domain-containing protein
MKTSRRHQLSTQGFTLLEMSMVILVLLSLVGIGLYSSRKMDENRLAREATETLRSVYTAQRMFLADNPTTLVSNITASNILPYLSGNPTALPKVTSATGAQLSLMVNVSPPRINAGSGVIYDPSGDPNDPKTFTDGLWDVGE